MGNLLIILIGILLKNDAKKNIKTLREVDHRIKADDLGYVNENPPPIGDGFLIVYR